MDNPLSIVIFSKDRAAQLDLCLKSIYKNLDSLSQKWKIEVIYTTSSEEFEKGYDSLKYNWDYSWLYFHEESVYGGFSAALETTMSEWGEYVLFFTDDDIVYQTFNNEFEEIEKGFVTNQDLMCISLRLGTNTFVQDQYKNSMCLIPDSVISSDKTLKTWKWKNESQQSNFAYPFSLDGHIFRSDKAKWIIKNTEGYYNPNSLEGKAHRIHIIENLCKDYEDDMACFEKSFVINTPINRVQETCFNGAGKFFGKTPEELNESFIQGKRLSLESMDFSTVIGTHQEMKLSWEK